MTTCILWCGFWVLSVPRIVRHSIQTIKGVSPKNKEALQSLSWILHVISWRSSRHYAHGRKIKRTAVRRQTASISQQAGVILIIHTCHRSMLRKSISALQRTTSIPNSLKEIDSWIRPDLAGSDAWNVISGPLSTSLCDTLMLSRIKTEEESVTGCRPSTPQEKGCSLLWICQFTHTCTETKCCSAMKGGHRKDDWTCPYRIRVILFELSHTLQVSPGRISVCGWLSFRWFNRSALLKGHPAIGIISRMVIELPGLLQWYGKYGSRIKTGPEIPSEIANILFLSSPQRKW